MHENMNFILSENCCYMTVNMVGNMVVLMVVNMGVTIGLNIGINILVRITGKIGVHMDVNGMRWYLGFYGMGWLGDGIWMDRMVCGGMG